MASPESLSSRDERPGWEEVAGRLEALDASPTSAQIALARTLGVDLPSDIPACVAAVVLKGALADVLLEPLRPPADIPDELHEIETELETTTRAWLVTGSRSEVSAWFQSRYNLKSARGLRQLQPQAGDVVLAPSGLRIVASIGPNGRIYFKGHLAGSAWPNHVQMVARGGSPDYTARAREADASLRNATISASTNFANYRPIEEFVVEETVPTAEAIRALEELLESGETGEQPFQTLLERHPALLSATVVGNWRTYVIPKQRLGAELIPDFLVLGISSVGPQWVTVEIEAARHPILNQNGSLSPATRHAVSQVQDWREWLTENVAYAQMQLGLYGLTNRAPGLVIVGRDTPSAMRRSARAQSDEGARIAIHSWDWLLRHALNLSGNGTYRSEFADENVEGRGTAARTSRPLAASDLDSEEPLELDDLFAD